MSGIKLYPNCVRLIGKKGEPYTTVHDVRAKPQVTSCERCDHYTKCLQQYRRFNNDPVTMKEASTSKTDEKYILEHAGATRFKNWWNNSMGRNLLRKVVSPRGGQ